MKHFAATTFVCCQLFLAVGHSYSQSQEGTETKMSRELSSARTQESGISLTAKLPSGVPSGSPIRLTAVLHNQGKGQVQVVLGYTDKVMVKMVDSQGVKVPLTRYGRKFYPPGPIFGSAGIKVLSPGESIQEELELQRIFDLTLPDIYTLSVSRGVYPPSGERLVLQVEKLSFEVTDPAP